MKRVAEMMSAWILNNKAVAANAPRAIGRVIAWHKSPFEIARHGAAWTYEDEDGVTLRWKESDLPGMGNALLKINLYMFAMREAALVEAGMQAKRVPGAAKGGRAKAKATESQRERIRRLALACRERGEDPMQNCTAWAEEFGYKNRDSVARIVREVLREP